MPPWSRRPSRWIVSRKVPNSALVPPARTIQCSPDGRVALGDDRQVRFRHSAALRSRAEHVRILGMSGRALSFGIVAEAYERFRPEYPVELFDMVMTYARRPVRTALEIGAGTGKATRLFAERGVRVTATEPDAAMLAELRKHVPASVTTVQAAFEDLRPRRPAAGAGWFVLAAALHWTNPEAVWARIAALAGARRRVFASFGGPVFHLARRPAVQEAVRAARAPFLDSDEVPSPDGTPPGRDMQWPGTELQRSEWFADVQQYAIGRRWTMSAANYTWSSIDRLGLSRIAGLGAAAGL